MCYRMGSITFKTDKSFFSEHVVTSVCVLMWQLLHEGCEGGGSGVEHAVAVQRAEDPLQTGQDQNAS